MSGLDLHYDNILNDEAEAVACAQADVLVYNRQCDLTTRGDAAPIKLMGKTKFIG